LPANARYINRPLAYLKDARWEALPDLITGPQEDEGIDPGWPGNLWTGAAVVAVGASFLPKKYWATRILVRVGLGISAILAGYFLFTKTEYRAAHGLLFTTPWALLGLTRARKVWGSGNPRPRAIILTTLIGLTGYTVMMIGFRASSPHGGLEWGARFALSFYPLLALVAAWDWDDQSRLDLVIIAVLMCLGLGFQARGILTIHKDQGINARLNQAILTTPEENIVSDLWWLLLNTAPIHPQKTLFAGQTPKAIAAWVDRAAEQGVQEFDLVTLNYGLPKALNQHLLRAEFTILELIQVDNLLIFRISLGDRYDRESRLRKILRHNAPQDDKLCELRKYSL
jgi:hypothetical protein